MKLTDAERQGCDPARIDLFDRFDGGELFERADALLLLDQLFELVGTLSLLLQFGN